MRARSASLGAGLALLAAIGAGAVWFGRPQGAAPDRTPSSTAPSPAANRVPTLYCEFMNFADRTPRVGFHFRIVENSRPPAYILIFQREQDGSQTDYSGEAAPAWTLEAGDGDATIRGPDDTAINLYAYDPAKPGTHWFEAGLRSIPYKNLGGRCRRSAG